MESYSEVILLKTASRQASFYSYPNPGTGNRRIVLKEMSGATIQLEVFDLKGQQVVAEEFPNEYGIQEWQSNWQNLISGTYLLRIRSGAFQGIERLVVQ